MKLLLSAILLAITVMPVSLQAKSYKPVIVSVDKIPANVEEFLSLRNELSGTPEGGAIVMLVSIMKFVEDQDMGRAFMVIALDRSNLKSGNSYKDYSPSTSLEYHLNRFTDPKRKHIPFAYVQGATPQNEYNVPLPYTFKVTRNKSSYQKEDQIKVFVACYGTDWPRPVSLKRNNKGIWKAYELSSLFLDVVGPSSQTTVDDDI